MAMKKKMSPVTKAKLIYLIELLVISIVFLVVAILEIVNVIRMKEIMLTIFNWLTLFGGLWMITDFVWTLVSKKRKAKASLLDKCLLLPLGIYLITFDLISLIGQISKTDNYDFYKYGISGVLFYVAIIYLFEAIYHWFHPIPGFIEQIQEEQEEQEEKEDEEEKNK